MFDVPYYVMILFFDFIEMGRMVYPLWLGLLETATLIATTWAWARRRYRTFKNLPIDEATAEFAIVSNVLAESGTQTHTHWHATRNKYYYGYDMGYTRAAMPERRPMIVQTVRHFSTRDPEWDFLRTYNERISENRILDERDQSRMHAQYLRLRPPALRLI